MDTSTLQANRILMYGRDSILLETRCLILKGAGFDVCTLTSLSTFRDALESAALPYKVAVLCHTVPEDEREQAAESAMRRQVETFQIETLIAPTKLVTEVSRLISQGVSSIDQGNRFPAMPEAATGKSLMEVCLLF